MTDSDHERTERELFLRELSAKRKKFQDGLDANEDDINLDIFGDFYPDNAHFVYELLQNAEDAKARRCRFVLFDDRCEFEHDGTDLFTKAHVKAITGIHTSTKTKAPDKIGNFGVGFKAVFVYTATPRIVSPTFSFEISNYVQLSPLAPDPQIASLTRFVLPFNNPKKPYADAYADVEKGLNDLSAAALLFLTSINTISWRIGDSPETHLLRIEHSAHHVEVVARNSVEQHGQHYLRFTEDVDGVDRPRHCAVAFELEPLPDIEEYDAGKPFAKQFRIVPASPGRVAVFFPAVKETSGLRFHLHAPFVPELSRASVKDTRANTPLFEQLAGLAAGVLPLIRDKGLLDREFLGVLPNMRDPIPERYQGIRAAIVTAMNEQALTPTHSGKHAPAKTLLQAKASLKSLLSAKNLAFLVGRESADWSVGVSQNNTDVDRFLGSLEIEDFDREEFVSLLEDRLKHDTYWDNTSWQWIERPDETFLTWLQDNPESWHQRLYAWLYDECRWRTSQLQESVLVRVSTGEYRVGKGCYFPTDEVEHGPPLPYVAKGVYTGGTNETQKENARRFLESIGVDKPREVDHIKAILTARYDDGSPEPDWKTHEHDLRRFIGLVATSHAHAELFKNYRMFLGTDGKWHTPLGIYLDMPHLDTGLTIYYDLLGDDTTCVALSDTYQNVGVSADRLLAFARSIGVRDRLIIEDVRDWMENRAYYCNHWRGARLRRNGTNKDWNIPKLEKVIAHHSVPLAKLIWNTMCRESEGRLTAEFSPNKSQPVKTATSTVVNLLTVNPWIPQGDGEFVRPAQADRARLPDGFLPNSGQPWIDAIGFGKEVAERQEEYRQKQAVATELGFDSKEALDDGKWFASLRPDERQRYKREHESQFCADLPDTEPADPERRAQRVAGQAADAPDRRTEKRQRSVPVDYQEVKEKARQDLHTRYTDPDGKMICQVCRRQRPLPFKLPNGQYYFEAVEFLPELKKRHYQNHLALCPNHAAMFRYANGSKDTLMSSFLQMEGQELPVVLAGEETSIYFTKKHIVDLKAVIEADQAATEEA